MYITVTIKESIFFVHVPCHNQGIKLVRKSFIHSLIHLLQCEPKHIFFGNCYTRISVSNLLIKGY